MKVAICIILALLLGFGSAFFFNWDWDARRALPDEASATPRLSPGDVILKPDPDYARQNQQPDAGDAPATADAADKPIVPSIPAAPTTRPATLVAIDADGKSHRLFDSAHPHPVVFIFISHDCPISNGYIPELNRIIDTLKNTPIAFYFVNVESDFSFAEIKKHAAEYKLGAPVLADFSHALVARAGATITPEAAVFDAAGEMVYRGRIDDRYVKLGTAQLEAKVHDLRDVLEAMNAGKPLASRTTKAFGCYISDLAAAPATQPAAVKASAKAGM